MGHSHKQIVEGIKIPKIEKKEEKKVKGKKK